MRLNWFSPLAPARTAIVQYTKGLLPALHEQAEIILWTDQVDWDPALEQYATVRQYHPEHVPWGDINRGDLSIYNIGNNRPFHEAIWQVSRSHPGIVILHDLCLQDFFLGVYRDRQNNRQGYLAAMESYYGLEGRQAAEAFWDGLLPLDSLCQRYPLTPLAVENALGIFFHTRQGLADLAGVSHCPMAYAPLPYPASPRPPQTRSATLSSLNRKPPYRIIIFGYINVNRRLDAVLQALDEFPERDLFSLDIYGHIIQRDQVCAQLQALGLQGLVTLHGFVPDAELDAALESAHLAINLRNPTMGESSFSQLQIWDHALPALVSQVGWYATLPQNTVAFVRPEHEILDIQTHLKAFIADPGYFMTMGEQGRQFLEAQHTPSIYAKSLLDLVSAAQRFSGHITTYQIAKRLSDDMRTWTSTPAPHVASYLWGQEEGVRQLLDRQASALTVEAIRRVVTEYVDRLQQQRVSTQLALQQAVVDRVEELSQLSGRTHRIPFQAQDSGNGATQASASIAGESTYGDEYAVLSIASIQPQTISSGACAHEQPSPVPRIAAADGIIITSDPSEERRSTKAPPSPKPYTRDFALRAPLTYQTHDTAFRYLFDFAIIAKSLDLRPGAQVLDFACGPTWVSELLNRLGYTTVAFDLDHEILTIGRERFALDARCDRDQTRFVSGDGTCLPFQDESFDGIICMNSFHHMPDYKATLTEMCRVLKPGGRAVFSEPGSEHSKHPESIHAVQEFGVLERDVVLSAVYQLAKQVGFQQMIVKPYIYPEYLDLDYEEFDKFRAGKNVSAANLTQQGIANILERGHPLFYLTKAGEKVLTSANASPELLRARLIVKECPSQLRREEILRIVAVCENIGKSLWLASQRALGGYVTFGMKILRPEGTLVDDSRGRQLLSEDVPIGGSIEVVSEVSLVDLEVGRYRIILDMVDEQITWFQNIGSEAIERWLDIV